MLIRILFLITALFSNTALSRTLDPQESKYNSFISLTLNPSNSCVSFTVGQGTGCLWMCSYCANQLGTNDYYFTDNVCTYQEEGCVGNPIAGKQYTCCQA